MANHKPLSFYKIGIDFFDVKQDDCSLLDFTKEIKARQEALIWGNNGLELTAAVAIWGASHKYDGLRDQLQLSLSTTKNLYPITLAQAF